MNRVCLGFMQIGILLLMLAIHVEINKTEGSAILVGVAGASFWISIITFNPTK